MHGDAYEELARWLAEHLPPEPPADIVARRGSRPPREVVAKLLSIEDGSQVTITHHEVLEDVDGLPLGIEEKRSSAAYVRPSLEVLGWTQAEWDDESVTE